MKKDNLLNPKEVASLLGTPLVTVLRWAYQGKIPCRLHDKEYYFVENEIRRWARSHHLPLGPPPRPAPRNKTRVLVCLSAALHRGRIFFDLPGNDIYSVLKNAVARLPLPSGGNQKLLLDELVNREEIASTGIGRGVAIPHPRHPLDLKLEFPQVSLMYLSTPTEFNAVDGKPVFALFVMLSPTTPVHLKILSRLSLCLQDKDFYRLLDQRSSQSEIIPKVEEIESRLQKNHGPAADPGNSKGRTPHP